MARPLDEMNACEREWTPDMASKRCATVFRSQDPVEAFLLRKPKRWARKRPCCFLMLAVLPVVFSGKPQPGRQYEIYIYI